MTKKIVVIESHELDNVFANLSHDDQNTLFCKSLTEVFTVPFNEIKLIILCLPVVDIADTTAIQLLKLHFDSLPIIVCYPDEPAYHNNFGQNNKNVALIKGMFDKTALYDAIDECLRRNNIFKLELKHADFKRHFHRGTIPMWLFDAETLQILDVNGAAIHNYGYSREEFLTMTVIDLHPKEDIDSFLETFEARDNAQFDNGYWRQVKKNGEIIFVNIYCHYAIVDDNETGLTFAFDVTDNLLADLSNKNTQNLAKGQKEQFDSILSTLSDAVWSIRADSLELIYANQAFYELFGFSPEEMTENIDPFFSSIHPDDQKAFRQTMQRVSYSQPSRMEYRFNHRDGTTRIFQVHVSLIKGKEGKPDTLNGVTMDITKERILQDKIRKSEQNLLATINNTKDMIWSVNPALEIIFCNKPFQEYVFAKSRLIPRPGDYVLGEWVAEHNIDTRKRDYDRALKGESFITIVEEIANGETTFREFSNNPIIDQDGKIIGVNCVARNITEQRKQFMKIREQNEKLMEIAWIQSHKVRSPVASILGLADLIDAEEGLEYNMNILTMLIGATKDLDKIIREVVEKSESLTN
jgi:PAS domain S-box-containing protein